MKRAAVLMSGVVVAVIGGSILPGLHPQLQAQQDCQSFVALAPATLPTSAPLSGSDVWGGPLEAKLNRVPLFGVFSGNDGDDGPSGGIGQGRDGSYTVCISYPVCTDSFTYEVPASVFPKPPGQDGLGLYSGNTAKIVSGTGKFAAASGNLNVGGSYLTWRDSGSPFGVSGRWNAELSGKICGVD